MKTKKFIAMAAAMTLIGNAGALITVNADMKVVETVIDTDSWLIDGNDDSIVAKYSIFDTGKITVDFFAPKEIPISDDDVVIKLFNSHDVAYYADQYQVKVIDGKFDFISSFRPFTNEKDELTCMLDVVTEDSHKLCLHELPESIPVSYIKEDIKQEDILFSLEFNPVCDISKEEDVFIGVADKKIIIEPTRVTVNKEPEKSVYDAVYTNTFDARLNGRWFLKENGDIYFILANKKIYDEVDNFKYVVAVPDEYTVTYDFAPCTENAEFTLVSEENGKKTYECKFDCVLDNYGALQWVKFERENNAVISDDIKFYEDVKGCIEKAMINLYAPSGIWGDANCDDKINMADVVLIMQSTSNPDKYGLNGSDENHITNQGQLNGDVYENGTGITNSDALSIQKFLLDLIDKLPE